MDLMELRPFGAGALVSALSLGGGGIGQVWGNTTRREAVATVLQAIEGGVSFLDMAPLYGDGEAERVVGEAFHGRLPPDVQLGTKVLLGDPPLPEIATRIRTSLARSLERMGVDRVDLLLLHGNLVPDGYVMARGARQQARFATPWSRYADTVRPTFEALRAEGLIGAWGISGVGLPKTVIAALRDEPRPAAVQVVTNLLDSAGAMRRFAEAARPRDVLRAAAEEGVPVMGIRAVQAGALTGGLDRELPPEHPDRLDWERCRPWRALARELGADPADLALRYAISLPDVATVVLGVKNRRELDAALAAAADGPLDAAIMARVDALGLRSGERATGA